jgi:adenylyltransferase/sulfurtransferase
MTFQQFKVRRNPRCPVCGDHPTIKQLIDYEEFCGMRGQPAPAADLPEITVEELKQRLDRKEDVYILDVRNPEEYQICRLPGSVLIPLPQLPQRVQELEGDREMIVHCKSGMRSQKAVQILRAAGFRQARNLKGGILAWAQRIDRAMPTY